MKTSLLLLLCIFGWTAWAQQPPTVQLIGTGKPDASHLDTLAFEANATDADGSIRKVEFFVNAKKMHTDLAAPYTFSWKNMAVGTHGIVAIAYDNDGNYARSAPRFIDVTSPLSDTLLNALDITLQQGLYRSEDDKRYDINLHLSRYADGAYALDAFGYGYDFNRADHWGKVTATYDSAGYSVVHLQLQVNPDPWISGGYVTWRLAMRTDGDKLSGHFSGEMKGETYTGSLSGTIKPQRFHHILGDEAGIYAPHPRLFFRTEDLPKLRTRAASPVGQKIMQRIQHSLDNNGVNGESIGYHAAGNCFLYALTDDKTYAQKAKQLTEQAIENNLPKPYWNSNDKMILRAPGKAGIAIAYDMCYHAWDTSFRQFVAGQLMEKTVELFEGGGSGYNTSPWSNWQAITQGAMGTVALSIAGDKGAFPSQPHPYNIFQLQSIAPQQSVSSGIFQGLTLKNDTMPGTWISLGTFKATDTTEHLRPLGGMAKAMPEANTIVGNDTFKVVDAAHYWSSAKWTKGLNALVLNTALGNQLESKGYFYTSVQNDSLRDVKLVFGLASTGIRKVRMWLNGTEVHDGQFLQLAKGRYHLMVEATLGQFDSWGKVFITPRFQTFRSADRDKTVTSYEHALRHWEAEKNLYVKQGKTMLEAKRYLKVAERRVQRYLATALGDKGYCTEGDHYGRYADTQGLSAFINAYSHVIGKDIDSDSTVSWLSVLHLYRMVSNAGKPYRPTSYGPGSMDWEFNFYRSGDVVAGFNRIDEKNNMHIR